MREVPGGGKKVGAQPGRTVIPYAEEEQEVVGRLGFMAGEIAVPDEFDRMGDEKIPALFGDVEP